MSKYINADTITKMVVKSIIGFQFTEDWTELAMKDFISKMPSADVVEVVRCKDCEFYDKERNGGLKEYGYCDVYKGYKKADGYCDCGERKETK